MCSFIAHHMQLVATDMCRLLNDCNCKKMLACGLLLWETRAFMKDKIVGNFLQKSLSLFFLDPTLATCTTLALGYKSCNFFLKLCVFLKLRHSNPRPLAREEPTSFCVS